MSISSKKAEFLEELRKDKINEVFKQKRLKTMERSNWESSSKYLNDLKPACDKLVHLMNTLGENNADSSFLDELLENFQQVRIAFTGVCHRNEEIDNSRTQQKVALSKDLQETHHTLNVLAQGIQILFDSTCFDKICQMLSPIHSSLIEHQIEALWVLINCCTTQNQILINRIEYSGVFANLLELFEVSESVSVLGDILHALSNACSGNLDMRDFLWKKEFIKTIIHRSESFPQSTDSEAQTFLEKQVGYMQSYIDVKPNQAFMSYLPFISLLCNAAKDFNQPYYDGVLSCLKILGNLANSSQMTVFFDLELDATLFEVLKRCQNNRETKRSIISILGILSSCEDVPYLLTRFNKYEVFKYFQEELNTETDKEILGDDLYFLSNLAVCEYQERLFFAENPDLFRSVLRELPSAHRKTLYYGLVCINHILVALNDDEQFFILCKNIEIVDILLELIDGVLVSGKTKCLVWILGIIEQILSAQNSYQQRIGHHQTNLTSRFLDSNYLCNLEKCQEHPNSKVLKLTTTILETYFVVEKN